MHCRLDKDDKALLLIFCNVRECLSLYIFDIRNEYIKIKMHFIIYYINNKCLYMISYEVFCVEVVLKNKGKLLSIIN